MVAAGVFCFDGGGGAPSREEGSAGGWGRGRQYGVSDFEA